MRFCACCGSRLGLLRYTYAGKQFCTKSCVTIYRERIDRLIDARLRRWWDYLYGQRP